MKAKEYAERYREIEKEKGEKAAISFVLLGMCGEISDLLKNRGCKTNAAAAAVVLEIEQRWKAFCRLVPIWKPDGMRLFLHEHMPELMLVLRIEGYDV